MKVTFEYILNQGHYIFRNIPYRYSILNIPKEMLNKEISV